VRVVARKGRGDGLPLGYPTEIEHEVVTSSGIPMTMRPIRPDDSTELARFHRSLTPRSVYRRFFYVHPDLSKLEIEHLTCVDYLDRLALVVMDHDGTLIAIGRYDRCPQTPEAEVAFVVADAYQHLGLGRLLLENLAASARRTGISVFQASVLAENREMLDVFSRSGLPLATSADLGVVSVRMAIESVSPH
jgi:GNAT superfamily N-acetyltransferase